MDMIEILGGLLRHKAGGGGAGAEILKDMFGGSRSRPQASPSTTSAGRPPGPKDIASQAKELEDLLIGAAQRQPTSTGRTTTPPAQPAPRPESFPRREPQPQTPSYVPPERTAGLDERALALVRAMVNAAKADGSVSREEQQSILRQLDGATPDTVQFLNEEFSKPLDVREFAWSVPLGLEADVYAISLIAINVDSHREQAYLDELAHALRIPTSVREQIHQQLRARRGG